MRFTGRILAGVLAALVATGAEAASLSSNEYTNSPQLGLIGVTPSLQANANYGAGITFGVIDTGGLASQIDFGGRIDTSKSACIIKNCAQSLSVTDNNGHGTFVTSEIIAGANGYGIVGVAPGAKAIEMKVLGATGSGTIADVAAGIRKAADNGAQILNLSLTFVVTPDLVSAINYAASKNVVIVFAGGNSSQNFMNNGIVTGFTDAAIQRMFFMGSTNLGKTISSFSNKPGSGGFRSTSGTFYAFKDDWLMADGENIWGASNYCTTQYGCSYYTQMSGTSMAAPQGAGAVGLIAARWPFLLNTPNQIVQILMQTAQDLGTKGHDTVYGSGFLRVDLAFQPIGTLAIQSQNGTKTSVSGSGIAARGATGKLSRLSASLSRAVAFDDYHRDFSLNLSNAILTKSSSLVAPALSVAATPSVSRSATLVDGSHLSLVADANESAAERVRGMPERAGFADNPLTPRRNFWSVNYVGAGENAGTYLAAGHGGNAALSFDEARWGGPSAFTGTDASASGALMGLVADSRFTTMGFATGATSRLALSMLTGEDSSLSPLGNTPTARGFAAGYTFAPSGDPAWGVSLSASMLDEKGMLLGSPTAGVLSLGSGASYAVGLATNLDLGEGYRLGFDAAEVTTASRSVSNSLVSGVSDLTALSFGAALSKTGIFAADDSMAFTVKKPLRVASGSASLDMAVGNDLSGNAIFEHDRVSLAPDGNETDFGGHYAAALVEGVHASLYAGLRLDADNVAGAHDAGAMVRLEASF